MLIRLHIWLKRFSHDVAQIMKNIQELYVIQANSMPHPQKRTGKVWLKLPVTIWTHYVPQQLINEPCHEKTFLILYKHNKDADHPSHPGSQISIFVVSSLYSILAKCKILKLKSRSFCSWAGRFESYLGQTLEDRISHDMAQMEPDRQCRPEHTDWFNL